MSYRKRALALSYQVEARIHLLYLGFQQSSRDSIRYTRYSSRRDGLWFMSQCNFLYCFFQCNLPEDTIDVEITVWTLKGIHTFRKDCSSQSSVWNPWGLQVKPLPLLLKKMEAYMEERWNIMNPFSSAQRYPNRSNPSPFSKKTTPTKRSKTQTRRSQKKFCKSRRMNGGHFIPAKAAKPTFTQPPTLVTMPPIPQALLQTQVSLCNHLTKWHRPNQRLDNPNRSQTFVLCAHLSVGSAQTIIYLHITQNSWNQKRKNWIGKKT